MKTTTSYTDFSDRELVAGTKRLAFEERRATAALIRSLMELDARRLYLAEGCASLFKYCTDVLRLSEDAAYNRMEIARAARRLPAILDALEEGALTLTSARRLAPHLTEDNCSEVLTAESICLRCAAHNRYEAELFFVVDYPGIVRETRPAWPACEFSSRNENGTGARATVGLGRPWINRCESPHARKGNVARRLNRHVAL